MAIPETQLETWSHQGSVAGSSATYQTVRRALLAQGTGYAGKDFEVFLQGSYGNDTNIYAESDVDVVTRLDSTFHHDLSGLSPSDRALFEATFTGATYAYDTFKSDVVKALKQAFGDANVEEGPKAVWIKPTPSRRSADVIVATQYRRYYSFKGIYSQNYTEGICFWSGYTQIVNYPKQHSANCTTKHQATNGWFKPMVRILKNMRTCMVDHGMIADGIAPSYFLEGLLYNVPNDKFGSSYVDTFVAAINWILENDRTQFLCANEQYYLLRDGPVTWAPANGKKFLDEIVTFWRDWD
jgi:hypothetical protein